MIRHAPRRLPSFPMNRFSFLLPASIYVFGLFTASSGFAGETRSMTLSACLDQALHANHLKPASRFAVAAAEAQHRQALSAYWPQLLLSGGFQRSDQAPNFVFPSSLMGIPSQTVTTEPSTALVTVPAGVLGPTAVQLPVSVPAQTITTPAQLFTVPAQDVQLLDRDLATGKVELTWLLFDGGMRKGLREQTAGLVTAMTEAARRTDLEITDQVHRYYYGAVLARQLHSLGRDSLARLEVTLGVTENLYQGGGGTVNKADYLDNKIMVETVRAMVAELEKNEALAQAALANTLGFSWRDSVAPVDAEIPFTPFDFELDATVSAAFQFNPDWRSLEAGLRAAEGAVRHARSGYAPKVALKGDLHRYWNDYDHGLYTRENKSGWAIGLGFEMPLFDGNLTRAKVAEMKARLGELREKGLLLQEGIGLQIKAAFLGIAAAAKTHAATTAAAQAAVENRELNERAYQQEAVTTEKVLRAQIYEALASARQL